MKSFKNKEWGRIPASKCCAVYLFKIEKLTIDGRSIIARLPVRGELATRGSKRVGRILCGRVVLFEEALADVGLLRVQAGDAGCAQEVFTEFLKSERIFFFFVSYK